MSVGLALIVRNEAANLPRLLASIEGAFDRVVLLDTGSKDGTVTLFQAWAQQQSGMTWSTASFEWVDDFAAARNAADQLLVTGLASRPEGAESGGDSPAGLAPPPSSLVDWTSWADADDTIVNAGALRAITEQAAPEVNALIFGYDYAQHPATGACVCHLRRERLVRAAHAGRWLGRVHEAQVGIDPVQHVADELCHWHHHKQEEENAAGISNSRNLRILRGWVKDEPEQPRVLAYLGTEHAIRGRHKQAIGYYKRFLKLTTTWDEERAQVCRKFAASLMALERFAEAERVALEAISVLPSWPDSYLTMAECALIAERPDKAIFHAQRALELGAPQTLLIINPFDYAVQPYRLFAHAYMKLGRPEEAIEAAQRVLDHQPDDAPTRALYFQARDTLKREHTAGTYVIAAEQLIAHDEQLKALELLQLAPVFAIDHPRVVALRSALRERLAWVHSPEAFAEHYQTGGSKPEDFHGDDMIAPICEQLPRVRFLLDGLAEQAAAA